MILLLRFKKIFPSTSVKNTRASASSTEVGLLFFYLVFSSRNLTSVSFHSCGAPRFSWVMSSLEVFPPQFPFHGSIHLPPTGLTTIRKV